MSDRLEDIETRWQATKPAPWKTSRSERDPLRMDVRHRGGGLVCERLDSHDAEALVQAPDDVAWLVNEVRRLRREVFRLGGGHQDGTIGKSRQGDITLATFKIDQVDSGSDPDDP